MRITSLAVAVALSLASFLEPSGAIAAGNQQTQQLHRVDFRVEGASCVACLRRVAKTLRESKGVVKADVSIYRPYWAIVIYDAKSTQFNKVTDPIAKAEKVRFVEVEDKVIPEMPLIVIPKVNTPPKASATTSAH